MLPDGFSSSVTLYVLNTEYYTTEFLGFYEFCVYLREYRFLSGRAKINDGAPERRSAEPREVVALSEYKTRLELSDTELQELMNFLLLVAGIDSDEVDQDRVSYFYKRFSIAYNKLNDRTLLTRVREAKIAQLVKREEQDREAWQQTIQEKADEALRLRVQAQVDLETGFIKPD